jgi:hypothetical protein
VSAVAFAKSAANILHSVIADGVSIKEAAQKEHARCGAGARRLPF